MVAARPLSVNNAPTFRVDPQRLAAPSFAWPVVGPVTSDFTPDHPLGIDVGLALFPASSVRASAGGIVVYVGGDPCCSYGYHVIVDHGNGYTTLYAHLSSFNVEPDQPVLKGQTLGTSGDTGFSTSEHLHFELRHNEIPLDPRAYLVKDPLLN